jgi:ubiquinone/menaquinone biosynthesis C-methylase UbiE
VKHETHFDRIAAAYNASLPSHVVAHYLDRRAAVLRGLVPPPGPVLDVGCGTGLLAWKLEQIGYQVTGLDSSHGMLQEPPAQQLPRRLLGDAGRLPVRDGAFPLVMTVATLHHLGARELVKATIEEMVRVTAPGGLAVIWDHNPLNPYWPLLMRRVPQDADVHRLVPLGEILGTLRGLPGLSVRYLRSGWVPDFAPRWSLRALGLVERALEATPGIRALSAHNVVLARKTA